MLDWLQIHVVIHSDKDYDFLALLAAPDVVDPVVWGLLLAAFDGGG